jgi:hypothetical protein
MISLSMISPMLAAADPLDILGGGPPVRPSRNLMGLQITDLLLVIICILAILTVLIIWAVFIRKPKNDQARTRIYKSHHRTDVEERDDGTIRKRKRHKRQRRAHRQRNPTLSEAGGLPPMRSDSTSPPV